MKLYRILLAALLCGVLTPSLLQAQVTFNEIDDGELSGDNAAPTDLVVFEEGVNTVSGTVVDALGASPNVDVFTFEVAVGTQLDGIFLNSFSSTDNLAFIGIDDSTSFPFDATELSNTPDQSQFIGGLLFGENVGTNLLDDIGSTFGSGFTGPLQAGDYTVYLQQLGGAAVDYEFGFSVSAVPEPGSAAVLALFGIVSLVRRRR